MFRVKARVTQVNTLSEPGMPVQLKLTDYEGFELWHSDGFDLFQDTKVLVAMTSDEFNRLDRMLAEGDDIQGLKPPETAVLLGSVYEFFLTRVPLVISAGVTREQVAAQLTQMWVNCNGDKIAAGLPAVQTVTVTTTPEGEEDARTE